jgi:hypothetical protein
MKDMWHHIITIERLNTYEIDYTQPNGLLKNIVLPSYNSI